MPKTTHEALTMCYDVYRTLGYTRGRFMHTFVPYPGGSETPVTCCLAGAVVIAAVPDIMDGRGPDASGFSYYGIFEQGVWMDSLHTLHLCLPPRFRGAVDQQSPRDRAVHLVRDLAKFNDTTGYQASLDLYRAAIAAARGDLFGFDEEAGRV